jgi:hypothetical protein
VASHNTGGDSNILIKGILAMLKGGETTGVKLLLPMVATSTLGAIIAVWEFSD